VDILPEPSAETRQSPSPHAPGASRKAAASPPTTAAQASRRGSPVYIAAVAGAAIGTVSVLAVYILLRQETPVVQHPASGSSPFVPRTAPAEVVLPEIASPPVVPPPSVVPSQSEVPVRTVVTAPIASPPPSPVASAPAVPLPPAQAPQPAPTPRDESRPAAVFASTPRVILTTPLPTAPKLPPPAKKTTPAQSTEGASRGAPKGPTWAFEGIIFDLLTARGVFAAKLSFRDADGNVIAETSTGGSGSYKIVLPAGGPRGYSLKISHGDYTERYIDEGDATSSLREATPEERKILMQAGVRNLPWVGVAQKSVRRDLGLVPRTPEEP